MRILRSVSLLVVSCACFAQTPSPPTIGGAGFANPFPIAVAPGQLLTLFVQPGSGYTPEGPPPSISATLWNQTAAEAMPVVQVGVAKFASLACVAPPNSTCANLLAITVQLPFDIPNGEPPLPVIPAGIALSVNGVSSRYYGVQGQPNHVHILTACDGIAGGSPPFQPTGLPCRPIVTHADGWQVSNILAAHPGEELIVYTTGLGQTNPPLTAGHAAAQSSPTVAQFNLDFNYWANALATRPGTVGATVVQPLFTGATQGYVGLYQINLVVPPIQPGMEACVNNAAVPGGGIAVASNLTVSVGSANSFDGAGICVTPAS